MVAYCKIQMWFAWPTQIIQFGSRIARLLITQVNNLPFSLHLHGYIKSRYIMSIKNEDIIFEVDRRLSYYPKYFKAKL